MKLLICFFLFVPGLVFAQNLNLDIDNAVITYDLTDEVDEGTIGGLKADIKLNLDDLDNSSIKASVEVATLTTQNEQRDGSIRDDEGHFDGKNHPLLSFESSKIIKTETGYMAYGSLTIKEITKEIKLPFIYQDNKVIARMKIHTGTYEVYGEAPEDEDAFNAVIRIQIPVK